MVKDEARNMIQTIELLRNLAHTHYVIDITDDRNVKKAIKLLKREIPKQTDSRQIRYTLGGRNIVVHYCPKCGFETVTEGTGYELNYCQRCGQRLEIEKQE